MKKLRVENERRAKYEKLEEEHKHVKGIGDAMIDMMRKSEGTEGNLHDAWRWIKRVVW
jgi:hypothetical protein